MISDEQVLIGPFTQLLPLSGLPMCGPIADGQLEIICDAGILHSRGIILQVGSFKELLPVAKRVIPIDRPTVAIPGLIDSHTHLCFAGNRAADYALRVSGKSYEEIALNGGGILDTVFKTRLASKSELTDLTFQRCQRLIQLGITTCEVKSGYGLNVDDEIKLLEVIDSVSRLQPISLIPTCLAAHTCPPEFKENQVYLELLINDLLPHLHKRKLCKRIDIFVDEIAFSIDEARVYLKAAKNLGFEITLHADQFKRGGAQLAAELGAVSADHLEHSIAADFNALAQAAVSAIALPGASLGLGLPQPKVRQMLNSGLCVAIASDWNPGSSPQGNLLAAAAILGAVEKLSMAETLAGITVRAARALQLKDRGALSPQMRCDLALFPCSDYREILYYQGSMLPSQVFIEGRQCCQQCNS